MDTTKIIVETPDITNLTSGMNRVAIQEEFEYQLGKIKNTKFEADEIRRKLIRTNKAIESAESIMEVLEESRIDGNVHEVKMNLMVHAQMLNEQLSAKERELDEMNTQMEEAITIMQENLSDATGRK